MTPHRPTAPAALDDLAEAVVAAGHRAARPAPVRLGSSPLLVRLREAGTAHVYADTADRDELVDVASAPDGAFFREVDGNTVNQPLVRKVLDRYLSGGTWPRRLAGCGPLAPIAPLRTWRRISTRYCSAGSEGTPWGPPPVDPGR